VDQETANYIMRYFSSLMTVKESKAWKHWSTMSKMGENPKPARIRLSLERGWLTEDPEIIDLLKDGYDQFELKTAKRILKDNEDLVNLNNCPNCGRLTRTPNAKQCRHCGHDWH
jgi:ribosomal protein L32